MITMEEEWNLVSQNNQSNEIIYFIYKSKSMP